jgi:PAT family beta-lactamase induction signal transducer AmpG
VAAPDAQSMSTPVRREARHLVWTSTTNFGEGLPWSVLHQLTLEFLTALGVSKTQISSTSLLHLPGTFRFAWSPLVDLYARKRRWVWGLEILMALGIFAVTATVPGRNLRAFWAALTVLAVMLAMHDVACDGFYLQALDKKEQALFSGTRAAAYRIAMWVGRSVLVVLAGLTAWHWAYGSAAVLMLLVAGVNFAVMPHVPEHRPRDEVRSAGREQHLSNLRTFLAAYRTFLTQPRAGLMLAFILVYRLGDIMMGAMATPMLKDIGIVTTARGVLASFGIGGFMAGSILGGLIVARWGLPRCLVPMTFFQNLMIPLYIVPAIWKPGFYGVLPVVIAEQFASGIGNSANAVYLMQRCRTEFASSHFAFATSLVSLTSVVSGFVSGPINDRVGHPLFFLIAFLATIPSLVLVFLVPREPVEPAVAVLPQR